MARQGGTWANFSGIKILYARFYRDVANYRSLLQSVSIYFFTQSSQRLPSDIGCAIRGSSVRPVRATFVLIQSSNSEWVQGIVLNCESILHVRIKLRVGDSHSVGRASGCWVVVSSGSRAIVETCGYEVSGGVICVIVCRRSNLACQRSDR